MLKLSKIKLLNKLLYFFVIFLLFASSCVKQKTYYDKGSGYFDFSNEKFGTDTIYNLSGKWEFYWDTLLIPSQLANYNGNKTLVDVPSLWTNYKIDNKNLPSFGFATYHAVIIIPEDRFYCLKLKRIFLSSNVFIDDSLIYSGGIVSSSPEKYKPSRITKELIFYSSKDTIDLTIQVANFSHKKAGILRDIKFGTPKAVTKNIYSNLLYDMFIFGALGFMLIFYFILYFYNKQNISNLLFSLFLLTELVLISLNRELIFFRIFPDFNWTLSIKIYYIAFSLRTLMFVIFIESFTRRIFSKFVKKGTIYFTIAIILFIIVTPMKIYSHSLIVLVIFVLTTIVYEIYISIRYARFDKTIAFAYIGLIIMLVSSINDALFEYKIIKSFYSSGLSIFIFTLLQSVLLSIKNTSILNKEDSLVSREEIQNNLKLALLNTPSYDLPGTFQALIKSIGLEKIILFTIDNEEIIYSIIAQESITKDNINEKIDFKKEYFLFDINIIKYSFDNKKSTFSKKHRASDAYRSKRNVKSIVTLPIIKDNRVIALVYFENKKKRMSQALVEVLQKAQTQFYSLINTAVTYFNLIRLNAELDDKVKERTKEVNEQKNELDEKNQQLDEKIQLLEEQNTIQQELNHELEVKIIETDKENTILEEQTIKITNQKKKIEKNNKIINKNISYASKILFALSNIETKIPFKEFFYLDLPKNIVGGDFFLSVKVDNTFIFALADATGHGVPGALMRIFANNKIKKIINKNIHQNKEIIPHEILNQLRTNIKNSFSSEFKQLSEGLDISFCIYNTDTKMLNFAGAYSSAIIISNNEISILKGDRMPVGKYIEGFENSFTTKSCQLQENDIIYLYTDGYVDQFSSSKNQKYYLSNFKNFLLTIHQRPLNIQ